MPVTYLETLTPQQRRRYEAKRLLTPVVRAELMAKADYTCSYCGQRGDLVRGPDGSRWHFDHVTPLKRGGDVGLANVALSCRRCNLDKGTRTPEEWRA